MEGRRICTFGCAVLDVPGSRMQHVLFAQRHMQVTVTE
jgi:hypothetical protein